MSPLSARTMNAHPDDALRKVATMTTVLWINGPFGGGKSTTLLHLVAQGPQWHPYDPEWVGYMLKANLHGMDIADFQDLPAWRSLVPAVAGHLARAVGKDLAAPQTITVPAYWREIREGLQAEGLGLVHAVLDCDDAMLRRRIEGDAADPGAREWRLGHLESWAHARQWLRTEADLYIDTTSLHPEDVVSRLVQGIKALAV